ncbi:MAG TPA: hypothetical protein VGJ70_06755, partial [Solirubrobacteraceae bacterium]
MARRSGRAVQIRVVVAGSSGCIPFFVAAVTRVRFRGDVEVLVLVAILVLVAFVGVRIALIGGVALVIALIPLVPLLVLRDCIAALSAPALRRDLRLFGVLP